MATSVATKFILKWHDRLTSNPFLIDELEEEYKQLKREDGKLVYRKLIELLKSAVKTDGRSIKQIEKNGLFSVMLKAQPEQQKTLRMLAVKNRPEVIAFMTGEQRVDSAIYKEAVRIDPTVAYLVSDIDVDQEQEMLSQYFYKSLVRMTPEQARQAMKRTIKGQIKIKLAMKLRLGIKALFGIDEIADIVLGVILIFCVIFAIVSAM